MLLERETELDKVTTALHRARSGQGGLIILRGPIGSGKSTVLHALRGLTADDTVKILRASSSSLEQNFAFGVVRQLIEPILSSSPADVRERWLTGAAGMSRMVFSDDVPPSPGRSAATIREAVLLGLTALIGNISEDFPLLFLVDDIQWVDTPSLCLLTTLARHSCQKRVLIVAAIRDGDIRANRTMISELAAVAMHELWLAPLSITATRRFIEEVLGQAPEEEFVNACHEVSDGNPMILESLTHNVTYHSLSPEAEHASWLRSLRPDQLRDRLIQCFDAQDPAVKAFGRALAVLGDRADLDLVGRLTCLDLVGCREAMHTMQQLGLLKDKGRLEFTHLVVKDAIEGTMTTADRERLNLDAVHLLHRTGCPAEQVAAQLLAITSQHGCWAVEILRAAADTAVRRGAPEVAARYLRRALLDASPDGEDRAQLLVELATVELGLDLTAAVQHIAYAVPLLRTARDKAAAVVRIAPAMLVHDQLPVPVRDLIAEVVTQLGDPATLSGPERDLALRLETMLWHSAQGDPAELDDAVLRLAGLGSDPAMDTGAERELLIVLAYAGTISAKVPADEVARLMTRVLEAERASPGHVHTALPLAMIIMAAAGRVTPLVPWLDTALNKTRQHDAGIEQALIRAEQSLALLYLGRVHEARSTALEVAAFEWSTTNAVTSAVLSAVALELRDPELTNRMLARRPDRANSEPLDATDWMLRASVAATTGNFRQALDYILECGRQLDRSGWLNPVLFPWQTTAALLYHRLGNTECALSYAEDARARALNWGAPVGIGRALRTLGSLTPGQPGTELLGEAVAVLAASENSLELAKAQLQLGTRLRAANDPVAGALLRSAHKIIRDHGGPQLMAEAGSPVRAPGGTKAVEPFRALTKAEIKVVNLAVGDHTNQKIAEILNISCRAVEKHLTNAYRKLGIRRRTELPGALVCSPASHNQMLTIGRL